MNFNQIINMIIRQITRRGVNGAINMGMDKLMSRRPDGRTQIRRPDPEDEAPRDDQ